MMYVLVEPVVMFKDNVCMMICMMLWYMYQYVIRLCFRAEPVVLLSGPVILLRSCSIWKSCILDCNYFRHIRYEEAIGTP